MSQCVKGVAPTKLIVSGQKTKIMCSNKSVVHVVLTNSNQLKPASEELHQERLHASLPSKNSKDILESILTYL